MPSVEFARRLTVPTSPPATWETVTNVSTVASWVTVVGSVEEHEPLSRYSAVLADRLGAFQLSADLEVVVTAVNEPTSITFSADGEDRQIGSRIRIDAEMRLQPDDTGTLVDVVGRYEVTGRVAALGSSMIRAKGEKILDQFFSSLEAELS